jgi:nanoRNase/pAp phosphatase (c-di-AMP/oligoRNAs hydrolase)
MVSLRNREDLEIYLWDHHDPPGTIQADRKCREKTGSTVTLLLRQLKNEKKELTPIQATLFLAGIYEDTRNLTFPSSTAEDAYAAAVWLSGAVKGTV